MNGVRVGGRLYSDPDVISLIRATGELVDPRTAVISLAARLNQEFETLADGALHPMERLTLIASLCGLDVQPMSTTTRQSEQRDAVLIPTTGPRKGTVVYNPTRPSGRVAFSIAHEIAHTFFPNSISGARFRAICTDGSKEANELERLCDLAASELLMPCAKFRAALRGEFGLHVVPRLAEQFGASYEATVFKLATASLGTAISGLLRYRLRRGEERKLLANRCQASLFLDLPNNVTPTDPVPKYRRQSLHMSEACTDHHAIRWNKSFPETSCVYAASQNPGVHRATEILPNDDGSYGTMEATKAPYQRPDADPALGDVLFLWWK
jgi:hypothetical protein